jgi:mannitol-1-/sugar-/sorbitol-6-phosphatase
VTPPTIPILQCRAILFDLDGVLVDSRRCIERIWRTWAATRGLDAEPFLRVAHGRRTAETLRLVAPDLDAAAAVGALDAMEAVETQGLSVAPGATTLVSRLPPSSWAIVTSGSHAVATLRLRTAGLPVPRVLITSEEVRRGKPDPEGYLTAATRLAVAPADCVVVEDSPAGVAAGKGAGMRVIAVLTTHSAPSLTEADEHIGALSDLHIRAPGAEPHRLLIEC